MGEVNKKVLKPPLEAITEKPCSQEKELEMLSLRPSQFYIAKKYVLVPVVTKKYYALFSGNGGVDVESWEK
jgi:hypothetical protein